jgi:hypothetical protein
MLKLRSAGGCLVLCLGNWERGSRRTRAGGWRCGPGVAAVPRGPGQRVPSWPALSLASRRLAPPRRPARRRVCGGTWAGCRLHIEEGDAGARALHGALERVVIRAAPRQPHALPRLRQPATPPPTSRRTRACRLYNAHNTPHATPGKSRRSRAQDCRGKSGEGDSEMRRDCCMYAKSGGRRVPSYRYRSPTPTVAVHAGVY